MNGARIVFVTGHSFGVAALQGIIQSAAYAEGAVKVVSILGLHPRKALSTVGYADVTPLSLQLGLPAVSFDSIKSEFVSQYLSTIPHDYLFVVGLSQLVPLSILRLPAIHNRANQINDLSYGCIGMHPTILPEGRGRAPIPWTIIKRLEVSGVTAFFLEADADSGGIVASITHSISPNETATSLFDKVEQAHFDLGNRLSHLCKIRKMTCKHQDLESGSVWPRRSPDDGWLDFARPAEELTFLVRALTKPYPGAFFTHQKTVVRVGEASTMPYAAAEPVGMVLFANEESLVVKTKTDALRLSQLSYSGHHTLPQVGSILFSSEMEVEIGK
jgi:methionyl-tRNA formyltransferase